MWLELLGLAVLCVCWILMTPYKWRSYAAYRAVENIPGPRRLPIVGSMFEFNLGHEDVLPATVDLYNKYGPIFKFWIFGHLAVFLTEPEDIEIILSNNQEISKADVYRFLHPWLGTGLLTSTGSKWQTRRKLLTPTFHFKILEDYVEVFNSNSAILVQRLAEEPDTVVDINAFMTLCTLDIICETAMGTSVHAQQGGGRDYIQAVKRMGEIFQDRQLTFRLQVDLIYPLTPTGREQKRVLKVLHGFTEEMIRKKRAEYRQRQLDVDSAEKTSRKRMTFLDLLIEISETEGQLSDLDIREEVDTFMFEGHDTTAAALCWAVFMLGHNLHIQEKVFEEMQEIFGADDREPTMSDLLQMTYLDRVVKETLRLYPSVPAISRTLDSPVQIRGFTIPDGANIPIIPCILHRNPKLYPDPETFDPDHFLPEKVQGRHPYAYIPFSAGPRSCIGQRFARLEEKAVLSMLVRKFRIKSLDRKEDVVLMMDLILRPLKGLRIKFTPR